MSKLKKKKGKESFGVTISTSGSAMVSSPETPTSYDIIMVSPMMSSHNPSLKWCICTHLPMGNPPNTTLLSQCLTKSQSRTIQWMFIYFFKLWYRTRTSNLMMTPEWGNKWEGFRENRNNSHTESGLGKREIPGDSGPYRVLPSYLIGYICIQSVFMLIQCTVDVDPDLHFSLRAHIQLSSFLINDMFHLFLFFLISVLLHYCSLFAATSSLHVPQHWMHGILSQQISRWWQKWTMPVLNVLARRSPGHRVTDNA